LDVSGFAEMLTRAGLDITPLEVAEVLWLAQYASPAASAAADGRDALPPAEPRPAGATEWRQRQKPGPSRPARVRLHLPRETGDTAQAQPAGSGTQVRVPASTALPDSTALLRALRPLRLRAPDARRRALDEAATIDATARAGTLVPVLRAPPERRLSLTLVVDTGPAMAIWTKLEAELTVLLQRLGAFRDLQRWYLRTDGGTVLGLSRAMRSSMADPTPRDPAELLDPTGNRVILFLTDAAGAAWYSGEVTRILRLWGSRGPVAILQPLPQQLWTFTALRTVLGRLSTVRQAAPNAELTFTPRSRVSRRLPGAGRDAGGTPVPVPVLGIGPDWLGEWARFVSGAAGAALDCAVTTTPARPARETQVPAPAQEDRGAAERVRQFTEQASPEARRLASYLAAAPLSLPVIRHVQQAMMPGSGPSYLAEILLGGLITTRGVPDYPDESQRWRYEFSPGVRDLLLRGLSRSDARRVLATVSQQLEARFGRGADEFAAVAAPPGPVRDELTPVSAASQPFAEIEAHVLERITGRFAPVAGNGDEATAGEPAQSSSGPPPGQAPEGNSLIRRYQRTGRVSDIDAAIAALRRAVPPPGAADRPAPGSAGRAAMSHAEVTTLLDLAIALRVRYLAVAEGADLDEAVDALRQTVHATSPGAIKAAAEHELATALGLRHARTGSPADITAAVEAARTAASAVSPDADEFPRYAGTAGELLLRRRQADGDSGDLADLDEAITWLREAPEHPGAGAALRAKLLTSLGTALRERAIWGGGASLTDTRRSNPAADLDEAVDALGAAIGLTPRDTGGRPAAQAAELAGRHAELGATLAFRARQAITSALGHPSRMGVPARAAMMTVPRSAEADLSRAAGTYRTAANLLPRDSADLASYLAALGDVMRELSLVTGEDAYLAEAVKVLRESVGHTYSNDLGLPGRMAALAGTLRIRYERSGHLGYLVEASQLLTDAVAGTPPDSGELAGYLMSLGACHEEMYAATGANRDLRTAAELFRRAAAVFDAAYGSEHSDTLSARLSQAHALHAAGLPDEARAAATGLLPALERVLGPDHPDVVSARELREALGR
jgi:hypothetical protein